MRALRVRRRIVWLLAAAAFGVAAIWGASSATADELDVSVGKVSGPVHSTDTTIWD
jgi:hypothetical protein